MIKKAWITGNGSVFSLSIESANPEQPLFVSSRWFPAKPIPQRPLRHVVNIGIFSEEDINELARLLDQYRTQ